MEQALYARCMELPRDKTILSGIQPSGTLHLGNYLGALQQWVALQEGNTAYYCIVDLHAVTVPYDSSELPTRVLDAVALYLAAGLDAERSVIFVQSQVSAHAELMWLLSTIASLGELKRMTQFKDKYATHKAEASLGLFAYPVLQAADILLYHPELVPVGEDQKQHLELTRDLAQRFNSRFGDVLTLPDAYINPDTARIMSLTDPTRKMSKSDPAKSYVGLTDTPDVIRQKILGATTDTEPVFSFTESGPAVQNLLTIYRALSGDTVTAIEERFAHSGYKEFKEALAELIVTHLKPLQERYAELRQNDDELRVLLQQGRARAQQVAQRTLQTVKERMGLI